MAFHLAHHRRAGFLAPVPAARMQKSLINTAEVAGTSLFFGALVSYQAAKGNAAGARMPAVAGIPADLLTGVAAHAAALLGLVPEKYASHASAIGDGALASYAVFAGGQLGLKIASSTAGSDTSVTDRANALSSSGEGQIRGYSNDPFVRSLQEGNPHLTPEQVLAAVQAR